MYIYIHIYGAFTLTVAYFECSSMNLKMKFQVESQSSISCSTRKLSVNSPPSSLQDWLDEKLERRGIDAVIYTRYILSILLQDNYDVESCKHNAADEDICSYYFCNDRKLKNCPCSKGSSRKSSDSFICNQHLNGDHEQRKKSAAVECLKSVSDEVVCQYILHAPFMGCHLHLPYSGLEFQCF